jgi:hypothetical protein
METPAAAKSKHKADTPGIINVGGRVYYAGVTSAGFPASFTDAFNGEVKKVYPCGEWLRVHREDGACREKRMPRKACKKVQSISSAAADPNSRVSFSKLSSKEQERVLKAAQARIGNDLRRTEVERDKLREASSKAADAHEKDVQRLAREKGVCCIHM